MQRALHLAAAILLVAAAGVCADHKGKPAPSPKAAAKVPPRNPGGAPKKGGGGINNPMNLPQRLLQMTPEQRDRILEKLPAAQQERVREQLERLDRMSPAEKERVSRQVQSLSALPPEQRQVIRQAMTGLQKLPAERKGPVRKELLSLLNTPEEDRAARLRSEDFKNNFSPEEQKILTDLSTALPPDYPMAGRK